MPCSACAWMTRYPPWDRHGVHVVPLPNGRCFTAFSCPRSGPRPLETVPKALGARKDPFAILPGSPLGLVGSYHACLGYAASLPPSSIPRSDDPSRPLALRARLVQPPRRGSTPLRPRRDRLFHHHRHVESHRRCTVHAFMASLPTTGAHVAPRYGVQHHQHRAGSAC